MGVISVVLLAGIILIAVPMVFGNHRYPQYQETEVKHNLHAIQLAIERYAVDSGGNYPLWINGGSYGEECNYPDDCRFIADHLVTESYMPKFPANPFARSGKLQDKTRKAVREMQEILLDPLQPGNTKPIAAPQYRFGNDHELMGNVLADPRFAEVLAGVDSDGNPVRKRSGSEVVYRCWDIEELDKPQYWLQGQFYYKSYGPVFAVSQLADSQPDYTDLSYGADIYVLGGYGSFRTKGQDVLGEEVTATVNPNGRQSLNLLNYTGLVIPGYDNRQASPIAVGIAGDGNLSFSTTNPNGIADGVVMVLSPAMDSQNGSAVRKSLTSMDERTHGKETEHAEDPSSSEAQEGSQ
ncbi:hypothetical protein KDL29_08180 [bacterium]|nr:hypothetical protein [bacterium]